jgi:hypothetical protein
MTTDTIVTITKEQALDSIRRAVAEKGEGYVYIERPEHGPDGYRYLNPDGTPSCIIGHVLHDAGLTDVKMFEAEHRNPLGVPVTLNETKFHEALRSDNVDLGIIINTRTAEALSSLQRDQDGGSPWGSILRRAEAYFA